MQNWVMLNSAWKAGRQGAAPPHSDQNVENLGKLELYSGTLRQNKYWLLITKCQLILCLIKFSKKFDSESFFGILALSCIHVHRCGIWYPRGHS